MVLEQQYRQQADELRHVLPALEYAHREVTGSPFVPVGFLQRLRRRVRRALVRVAEVSLGVTLLVENEYRELAVLEPRARALLTHLLKTGLVDNWRLGAAIPDQPYVVSCRLDLAPITLPSGKTVTMGGSTGGGVGRDAHEALIPALAELLERYSMTQWDEKEFVWGTYTMLRERDAVDPQRFAFFSAEQLIRDSFVRNRVDATTSLQWVRADSLLDGRSVLIPAQLVYMFYEDVYTDEPVFWDTTSNGTAAGVDAVDATYRAICEAMERDAFMLFWQNRLTPPQIDPASIPDAEVQRLLKVCARHRLSVHVLDCTTDLGVPTYVGVILDPYGEVSVAVSAATDFDVRTALQKVVFELLKFMHGAFSATGSTPERGRIVSMGERQRYWHSIDWRKEISFFISGEMRAYQDLVIPKVASGTAGEKLDALRWILKEKGYPCYTVDVTTPIARRAHLSVIRAIIPDLVPIHFREEEQYRGVARLYTAPVAMGYRSAPVDEASLNPTPHPFL